MAISIGERVFQKSRMESPLDGFTFEGSTSNAAGRTLVRHLRRLGARWSGAQAEAEAAAGVLSGLGEPLPVLATWAGGTGLPIVDEVTAQAISGVMAVHGYREGRPRRLWIDYVSCVTGVIAAQGALAAVLARLGGRRVEGVETSALQSGLFTVSQYLAVATTPSTDDDDVQIGDTDRGTPPPFTSGDGVLFELETLDAGLWQRFWSAIGADPVAVRKGWRPFMLRYATARSPLPPALHQACRKLPLAEIERIGASVGASVLRVRTVDDRIDDLRPGALFPWTFRSIGSGDPPAKRTSGYKPLAGYRVIESGRRVQGPVAGKILELLGATVIRIEPPGGDPLRGMPPTIDGCSSRFLALNRGKEVTEVDIKSDRGRRRLLELAAESDVFLHNWAPGKAEALELDAGTMARVNPRLVYAHASGWGDEFGTAPPLGTDFMVQAYSGLGGMVEPSWEQPRPSLMTLVDMLGGLVAAEGVLAGLVMAERSGCGQEVGSSLLSAVTVLQADVLEAQSYGGRPPAADIAGRPLAVRDGCLVIPADGRENLEAAAADPARFAARLAEMHAHEAIAYLDHLGIMGVPVTADLATIGTDRRFAALLERDGCSFVSPPWRFS